MAKEKTKNRITVLFCVLCVIALVCVLAVGVFYLLSSAEEARLTHFDYGYTVSAESDGGEILINSYRDRDGKEYFFLPNGVEGDSVALLFDGEGSFYVDGREYPLNESTSAFSELGEHTLKINNKEKKAVFMHGSITSVHIETDSKMLEELYADKSTKDAATVEILDGGKRVVTEALSYVKGRGNASWSDYAQKGFNIKFENKIDLFGMGAAKKYSLVTTYGDQSLLKNAFAYSLASAAGIASPDYKYVDLYINGNYLGVYILTERIEAGEGRVEISDLDKANRLANKGVDFDSVESETNSESGSPEKGSMRWAKLENTPDDIKSGYILEMNILGRYSDEPAGFVSNYGQPFSLKSPKYATEKEVEYVSSLYNEFEEALLSADGYNSKGRYYTDYIDLDSFVKMYLLQELTQNRDASELSEFMYLDGEGRFISGPVWDFDNALGAQVFVSGLKAEEEPTGWTVLSQDNNDYHGSGLFQLLNLHADFRNAAAKEWKTTFAKLAKRTAEAVAQDGSSYAPSAAMNAVRWKRYSAYGIEENEARYNDAVNSLNSFIEKRSAFLSGGLTENSFVLICAENLTDEKLGASPFTALYAAQGEKLTLGECTAQTSRAFTGWNTERDGSGTAYSAGDSITAKGNTLTLYAQWSPESKLGKIKLKIKKLVKKIYDSVSFRYRRLTS